MSDSAAAPDIGVETLSSSQPTAGIFSGRRGRKLRESLLAYALLFPAFLIVFVFGIFPLAFSAYESTLRGLNRVLGTYDGLGNYVRAVDNLAYVLGFWLAIMLVFLAARTILRLKQEAESFGDNPWILLVPGITLGIAIALFVRLIFVLLPEMLAIPDKMRDTGLELTGQLFRQILFETLALDTVRSAFLIALLALVAGIALTYAVFRLTRRSRHAGQYLGAIIQSTIFVLMAAGLFWLTFTEIQTAYAEALESGETLQIWDQLILISAGIVLLLISWLLFKSASRRSSNVSALLILAGASVLIVGAVVLIMQLPAAVGAGNDDWWLGLQTTVYYSLGTVPVQLVIGLLLASLLYQNIRGKSIFRMIYFLPYIAPFVGTAAAFRILFSGRTNGPINSFLSSIGLEPMLWLNEPRGIFEMMFPNVPFPDALVGPSLALIVIIIFGTWSYFGFNTVVFLAGLGSIPGELYEAAAIDGASRWDQFRNVTLPLLSPTIYFLTLWSVIGTFKAFNHIYVLREAAALGTTDTASVVIFQAFNRDTRYGYASALAILLLLIIMILTIVNNRVASRRVFYG